MVKQEEKEQIERMLEVVEPPVLGLVAAYGTLRNGHGNWRWHLQGNSTFLGTYKTEPRYTMYGKGAGFPVVVDKGDTAIEYDVFAVHKASALKSVDSLEGCNHPQGHPSNWYDFEMIDTPHGKAKMYVMHTEGSRSNVIESGNWNDQ